MTKKEAYKEILQHPGYEIFSEESSISSTKRYIVVRSFNEGVNNYYEKYFEKDLMSEAIDCFLNISQYDRIGKSEEEVNIYEELNDECS